MRRLARGHRATHGAKIHRLLCESSQETAVVVAHWEEERYVECEVIDLSTPVDVSAAEIE